MPQRGEKYLPFPIKASSKLVQMGLKYPMKIGGGGKLQFYNPVSGKYISGAQMNKTRGEFIFGFSQGFVPKVLPIGGTVSIPPGGTKAQVLGQQTGKMAADLFKLGKSLIMR